MLRKALWLKIAVFAIEEHKTIKPAIEIMKESDCLKIEDILPHFPDFVVIDDFKEDICSALEEYHSFIRFRVELSTDIRSCVVGTAATLMDCVAVWMKLPSAQTASARCGVLSVVFGLSFDNSLWLVTGHSRTAFQGHQYSRKSNLRRVQSARSFDVSLRFPLPPCVSLPLLVLLRLEQHIRHRRPAQHRAPGTFDQGIVCLFCM